MKKKEEQLVRKVTDMIQKTREGKLHWDIQCQTTEVQRSGEETSGNRRGRDMGD